jgi:phosphoribosyl 1,2-cyclic phosphate phosphodiesterase
MFGYIFEDRTYPGVPHLDLHELSGPLDIVSREDPSRSVRVEPLTVRHGALDVAAFRIGKFAYVTDTNHIPHETRGRLDDLDVLVLDALRHEPHRTHFSVSEAVDEANRIGARQTVFVHMTHTMLHAEEDARLPEGMGLGWDGMRLTAHR